MAPPLKPKLNKEDETEAQKKVFVSVINTTANFVLTRYPYLCAVLLMVSMPEEIKDSSKPLPDFRLIYVQLGFYFVIGTVMSFDLFGWKRLAALVMSVNSIVEVFVEFNYSTKEVIVARLIFRKFAIIGCYLMVAGGLENPDEDDEELYSDDLNPRFIKFGRQIIGTYFVLLGIFMIHNRNEFSAHAHLLPGGVFVSWLIAIIYILCGITIDYGCLVVKACRLVLFLLSFVTLIVDCDSSIWVDKVGLHQWKMFSIASLHFPVVSVLMMIKEGLY